MSSVVDVDTRVRDGETIVKASTKTKRVPGFVKVFGALGVVAAVGVAGFVAGQSSATATVQEESTSDNDEGDNSVSTSAQARESLASSFEAGTNPALNAKLTPTVIEAALAEYDADPSAWDNQFLTPEILETFRTIREDDNGIAARRLGGRDLIGSYDETLVNAAWEKFEDGDFSNAVTFQNDEAFVESDGSTCWVVAQTSDDVADWVDNLDTGSSDFYALTETEVQDESCGCARSYFFFCARYRTCNTYRSLGEGYSGFMSAYNGIRLNLWNRIQSVCSSSQDLVLVGYSRGAGIVAPLGHAIAEDGLWSTSKMTLVTFGAPRVLADSASDNAHNQFTQWRMAYKGDMVPSLPYAWMGFKHFGTLRCFECSYSEARDRPFYSWNIGDHTSYCEEFGDGNC